MEHPHVARRVGSEPWMPAWNRVLCGSRLKPVATPPLRTRQTILSKWWLALPRRQRVYVPKAAIVRNHPTYPLTWNAKNPWTLLRPADVKVLAAMDPKGVMRYGWYARFLTAEDPEGHFLTKIPPEVVARQIHCLAQDVELCESSLLTLFHDFDLSADRNGWSFQEFAELRYGRVAKNLDLQDEREQRGKKRSREWSTPPCSPEHYLMGDNMMKCTYSVTHDPLKCLVCLEHHKSGNKCGTCGGTVCNGCHQDMRGLCPICDRADINARYLCSCCGSLRRLRNSGMPCVQCSRPVVCAECYHAFGECSECDALISV